MQETTYYNKPNTWTLHLGGGFISITEGYSGAIGKHFFHKVQCRAISFSILTAPLKQSCHSLYKEQRNAELTHSFEYIGGCIQS